MDIEKVIESMRSRVTDMQEAREDMNLAAWGKGGYGEQGMVISGNESRALLTEIDYWRTRCGKAEAFNASIGRKESPPAYKAWQDAVAGESDKARYLETLKPSLVE